MNLEGFAAVSRRERPEPAWPGKKIDSHVKFFLDNRGGRLYPSRFIKDGSTLLG